MSLMFGLHHSGLGHFGFGSNLFGINNFNFMCQSFHINVLRSKTNELLFFNWAVCGLNEVFFFTTQNYYSLKCRGNAGEYKIKIFT
jgi:hypothetical protein